MDLKETVKSYLLDKNSEYAILINGDWGSGKTHFWRTYIKGEVTAAKLKPIYISLYGNSSPESVKNHIISEIIANTVPGQNVIGQVISKIGNTIGKVLSKSDYQELFEGAVFNNYDFSKTVICFDDLERTSIDTKQVIGFINELVENKKAKVFILSNEKYIKENSGFNLVKEKTIGRTLNYKAIISEVIDELIKTINSESSFYQFLSPDKDFLINLTSEYRIQNLRTIKLCINYLSLIFNEGKNDLESIKKVRKQIMLFCLTISNEYSEGRLTSNDFENSKGIDEIDNSFYGKMFKPSFESFLGNHDEIDAVDAEKEEPPYSIGFYNRYLEKQISNFTFFNSIYQLIVGGNFNYSNFKDEISKIKDPPPEKESIQTFQQLINHSFRELNDDEFIKLTDEVLNNIVQGEYPIYQYSQLGNYFYFFSKQGLIKKTPAELKDIFDKGLEKSKGNTDAHEFSMEQILHFRDHNVEVELLKKQIKSIHDGLISLKLKEELKQFVSAINDGPEKMEEWFKKFLLKPIFNIIDIELLSKTILEAENKNIWWFTGEFEKRYNSTNISEFLNADKDGLTSLRDKLKEKEIDKETLPLRNHLVLILIEILDRVVKQLE